MPEPERIEPNFGVVDLIEHIETYGVDILPPVEIVKETMRAQNFFVALRNNWPDLFQVFSLGGPGGDFTISAPFQMPGKPQVNIPTFALTGRGPTFNFPQRIAAFDEPINLHGLVLEDVFREAYDLFLRTFPARQTFRIGVVHQATFHTGEVDCAAWLANRMLEFDDANLLGANCLLVYTDDICNIRVQLSPVQLQLATFIPGVMQSVEPQQKFGLQVILDVNNKSKEQPGPLDNEDIDRLLKRSNELFPDGLIRFLNKRKMS